MMGMNPFEITEKMADIIEQLSDARAPQGAKVPEALPTPPSGIRSSNAKAGKSIDQMTGKELLAKYMPTGR